MKIRSWCLRMAAMLLALGLAVMPAAAETVLVDYQDTYEYSYTWRVTDGWAPGWADVRMEAEVIYDQSTGEWHLAVPTYGQFAASVPPARLSRRYR